MGYRSDVCIVTRKSTYEDFMVAYTEMFGEAPRYDEVRVIAKDYVRIDWYDIKWYHSYTEVNFIEAYFHDYADYYEILRIGEEIDDVEYRAIVPESEDYRLYCHRSAEISLDSF